ncbi:hypothetical protein FOZ62_005386, partial [Perkinsus olseni]
YIDDLAPDMNQGTAASILMAAYAVGTFLASLVTGPLSDRLGRRPVFLTAMTIYTVAQFLMANAWDIGSFAGFRAMAGVAAGELSACGSPVRGKLREALAVETDAPDSHLFVEIDQGLSLGVGPHVPPTRVYPAAKLKKHLDKFMEVFNLKLGYRNFSSVELQPEIRQVILL